MANGHTLAGFAIGTLRLASMATLQLRARHKTKNLFPKNDFYFLAIQAKKDIYYNLVFIATLFSKLYSMSILKIITSYFTHCFA